jgi:hypothetical protein
MASYMWEFDHESISSRGETRPTRVLRKKKQRGQVNPFPADARDHANWNSRQPPAPTKLAHVNTRGPYPARPLQANFVLQQTNKQTKIKGDRRWLLPR